MLIRREKPADPAAIHAVTKAAFTKPGKPEPIEAALVDELRADDGWIPELSLVAVVDGGVVGHVTCTRGWIAVDCGLGETAQGQLAGRAAVIEIPVLGLGPLSVLPEFQRRGVGLALMHAVLGAADALGESVVCLLGSPDYYSRFGFGPAAQLGIAAPDPQWGRYFQARPLSAYDETISGSFRYAEPFSRL